MRKIRNPELLDQLQANEPQPFSGQVWRMARAGRNPLTASSPKGRWDDGSFDVLYTAREPDTARAEVYYHLTRAQPVFPSGLKIHLHELNADLQKVFAFESVEALAALGVDPATYGTMDYARLQAEYSVTQQIGEAAHFLGADAIMVPSARWPGQNLVVLLATSLVHQKDHGPQDLKSWALKNLK
jgi:RES domain-containing protein